MNDELREGWQWCSINQIAHHVTSGSRDWSRFYSKAGTAYFVRSAEINDYTFRLSEAIRVSLPVAVEGKRTLIEPGDILVTITGANVGKCAKVDGSIPEAYVSQSVALIKIIDSSLTPFVYFALRAPNVGSKQLTDMAYGVGRPVLSLPQIRSIQVPLPPLAEQRRIVANLEQLLGKVNACQQRLAKVSVLLKRFRQSVLAAACSGRLTSDWREKQQTSVEDWTESKLVEVLAEPLSNGRSVINAAVGFPVLRLTCLKNGRIDLSERKVGAWTREAAKQFLVRKGDFFVSRGSGSLTHVGRGGLVENEPDLVAYPDTLIRVRVRKDVIEPTFLQRAWSSRVLRDQIESAAHTTAGIWKISQKDLEGFVLPIPAIAEQREVVRRVEALFAIADQIEVRLAKAQEDVNKLTASVLSKAFRGELVPTEAELALHNKRDYEPASVLLERVQQLRVGDEGKIVRSTRAKTSTAASKIKRTARSARRAGMSR